MIRVICALVVSLLLTGIQPAAAKRVALVIGNSNYQHVPELVNPKNDAEAVAAALARLDFEVIKGVDLNRSAFENKVREFSRAIRGADIALFYYAGHGLQVNGRNYLAPIETQLLDEADLDFEALRLQVVMSQMEREPRTNLVILDACRNNPLARNLARSMGTRSASIGRGLAPIESGVGTLIAFATQPGNVALDGKGENSPFTEALVKHLETPGEDIAVTLRRVRQDVIVDTNGAQVPWNNSSLTGPVVLKAKPDTTKMAADDADTGATQDAQIELAFWSSIKDSGSAGYFESYLAQYPNGRFAAIAELKVKELGKASEVEQTKIATASPTTKPRAKAENSSLNAGTGTQDEGVSKFAALPSAQTTISTSENSESVAGSSSPSIDHPSAKNLEPVELDRERRKGLQMALANLGHDPGPADGQFGPRTRSAIIAAREALDLPPGEHIDLALLNRLPDIEKLKALQSNEARRYSLSDLPENADPRLRKAVEALSNYDIKLDYFRGHIYIAVLTWGRDWTYSKDIAERAGGHLVTITSSAENNFVYQLFAGDDRFIYQLSDGQKKGPYIGLHQKNGAREPMGGWVWVTGEPVTYKAWSGGQPNNFKGGQDYAGFHSFQGRASRWDDNDINSGTRGFVMEVE